MEHTLTSPDDFRIRFTPIESTTVRDAAWFLEHYLSLWAHWMHSKADDLPDGCPTEASGGAENYTSLTDFDGMCERMDAEHAQLVHIGIWRLPETQRNAIYVERGIISLFEPRDYEGTLREAKERLRRELVTLGLWFGPA